MGRLKNKERTMTFSKHAVARIEKRDVKRSQVRNTLRNGRVIQRDRRCMRVALGLLTVVFDYIDGRVVTVFWREAKA